MLSIVLKSHSYLHNHHHSQGHANHRSPPSPLWFGLQHSSHAVQRQVIVQLIFSRGALGLSTQCRKELLSNCHEVRVSGTLLT